MILNCIQLYIYKPIINYLYAPILIVLSVFNAFVLRQVLGNGSTIVFHYVELIADLFMIITPWATDILRLDDLVGTCLFTQTYKYTLITVLVTENPFSIVNSLLPILSNLLLAIDRYRAVVHPYKWKAKYDNTRYAIKFTFYTLLIIFIIATFQWTCVLAFAAVFTYIWPNYFSSTVTLQYFGSPYSYWGFATELIPFFNQLTTDIATIVICIFQTYALIVFMRSFSKKKIQLKGASEQQRLKKMKAVRGLVVGTICSQTLVSFVFSVLSLGEVPSVGLYHLSTSQAAVDAGDAQLANWNLQVGGPIANLSVDSRPFYRLINMSTNLVTIAWHVLFCAQYRMGMITVWGKLKVTVMRHNQVVPITTHAHTQDSASKAEKNTL
jgi:hypothetical protein